MSCFFQIKI